MQPFLDAFVVLVVGLHERHTHSEIGDTQFGIIFSDALQKPFYGFEQTINLFCLLILVIVNFIFLLIC